MKLLKSYLMLPVDIGLPLHMILILQVQPE